MEAEFTMSDTDEPIWTIWNGFSPPIIKGPKTDPPPKDWSSLNDMFADNKPGIIKTLAESDNLQKG